MIEVKIESLRASLMSEHRVIILKDVNSERLLPIWIGRCEAEAIAIQLQNVEVVRPLTHDLIGNILTALGVTVLRVVINDLRDNTYFARLFLKEENELGKKIVEIDSRPSDCMAIAKMKKCPLFVTRKVFDIVGKPST